MISYEASYYENTGRYTIYRNVDSDVYKRQGDLYPTHEIGPISKYLNINRGNRFLTLTSTASKSRGLDIRAAEIYGEQNPIWRRHALGDIITTVLKCAGGETVTIMHDTSLPRPYCRGNAVHGTKGIWMELKMCIRDSQSAVPTPQNSYPRKE